MAQKSLKKFLEDVRVEYDLAVGGPGGNDLETKIDKDNDLIDQQKMLAKELFGMKVTGSENRRKVLVERLNPGNAPGPVEYGETWGP